MKQKEIGDMPKIMLTEYGKFFSTREADDFVLSTGKTHSVRHFLETAFSCVNIEIKWEGKGLNEKGIDKNSGNVLVEINKQYCRPLEVHYLCGDSSKARKS